LFAIEKPFSQSEADFDPSLNGSFSSVVGDFFRLSIHTTYRYTAPSNTGTTNQQEKRQTLSGDEPKIAPTTDPAMIPFFFEHLTLSFLQRGHRLSLVIQRSGTQEWTLLVIVADRAAV